MSFGRPRTVLHKEIRNPAATNHQQASIDHIHRAAMFTDVMLCCTAVFQVAACINVGNLTNDYHYTASRLINNG